MTAPKIPTERLNARLDLLEKGIRLTMNEGERKWLTEDAEIVRELLAHRAADRVSVSREAAERAADMIESDIVTDEDNAWPVSDETRATLAELRAALGGS